MNEFLERYKQLGEEFEPEGIIIPRAIRINTLKAVPEKIVKRLEKEEIIVQKVPYLDFGYVVESAKFSVGAATEHLLGYYYVQEVAAQVPV
ncbi:MAG TPA: tRNA methyltransferase, partial [Candidatus Nanoarchaeia archaeon]|nr:tRNA methyltransferase [Candidatus Nanoarchaeia archaeon]